METLKLYISKMEERLLRKRGIYKNIVLGILVIVVLFLTYKVISFKPLDTTKYENSIDSLKGINKELNLDIELFKETVAKLNLEQDEHIQIADSLHEIVATTKLPCEKVVSYQNKEIVALRGALEVCNKTKVIQVKTMDICSDVIVNYELIQIEHTKLKKVSKKAVRKAKTRAFFSGVVVGATIVGLLILI